MDSTTIDQLRDRIGDRVVIASMSGGKDSAAMGLYLQELEIPFTPVFMDTGWESPGTYDYILGPLTDRFGPITRIRAEVELPDETEAIALEFEERMGHYSAMVRLCLKKGMFPSRVRRWCTQYLKVDIIRAYLDGLDWEPISTVGIRGAESKARAGMAEWEWSDDLDCDIWRPIHSWTEQDVIDCHTRNGLPPNPLYLRGSERVGCRPCIFARKAELAAMGHHEPERIALIADLESVVGDLAEARARAKGMTLKEAGHVRPTFFQSRHDDRKRIVCPACGGTGLHGGACDVGGAACPKCKGTKMTRDKGTRGDMWPITKVIRWSQERRRGQNELFAPSFRDQGCMRWGLCDHGPAK